MNTNPDIKILVSCHKPVALPKSDLYLPVHVGAANAKAPLPGMQPDNEGDNISDRNFTYCELSGQYWAWKNLQADYVGQCHYRRYFCLGEYSHPATGVTNDHLQIEFPTLDKKTIKLCGLEDEASIAAAATSVDAIVPPTWDVSDVPTPLGPQPSIKTHMNAYGLIEKESFDVLESLVAKFHPEFSDTLNRYLNGHEYIGYNCFIMRKELFNQLCEFEFDVLAAFDEQFDYSGKTTTQKRICGYLGEILFSTFVLKLRESGNYAIKEAPLAFYFDTDVPTASATIKKAVRKIYRMIRS